MDQLFVNERLPSPSPPGTPRSIPEGSNPWAADSESASVSRGKGPELPSRAEEGESSWAENRARSLSLLEGRDEAPEPSWHITNEIQERDSESASFLDQYRDTSDVSASRPMLGTRRSTGHSSHHSQPGSGLLFSRETARNAISAQATPRRRSPSYFDMYGVEEDIQTQRNRSTFSAQSQNEIAPESGRIVPRRYSRPSRPYSYAGGSLLNEAPANVISPPSIGLLPNEVVERRSSTSEVVVPRWQPDAEVTFCPICRTQFSFFVRKHHCRKCGRVVCNSCSPHRITIPHQYIVQPPSDEATPPARPAMDSARARSQTVVTGLGGGERVRLCNPCVPDPNIAPPQTRSDGQPIQGHGRSQSTVPFSPTRRGELDIPSYRPRPREASITAEARQSRYWAGSPQPGVQQQTSNSFGQRSDSLVRPEALEVRSRSSTIGSTRDGGQNTNGHPRSEISTYSRPYQAHSRPLPSTPHGQQRPTARRRVREEDLCWICGHELPSRDLPNFEDLRSAHVMSCLEAATLRASGSPSRTATPAVPPPPPPSQSTQPQRSGFSYAGIDPRLLNVSTSASSASTPALPTSSSYNPLPPAAPPISTPESRMLARERQHAAIVLGQSSSLSGPSSAAAMSRVIPYIASEKDGIDDAECMVCMEEFEVGQEMGRLECFCRFHLTCIKGWFEKKPGKCPVHGGDFF